MPESISILQSSPFSQHLGTNYIPTDPDIKSIQEFLEEPLKRLSQLDDDIVRAQAIVDDLSRRREELSNAIESHRALLSPIRRLPLEVIQKIFLHCLPNRRNPAMSVIESPLLLGRICSLWRSISLSTPELWAQIHVSFPGPVTVDPNSYNSRDVIQICNEKLAARTRGVSEWLTRSGQMPLSFSLYINFTFVAPHDNIEGPEIVISNILRSCVRRLKEVRLEVPLSGSLFRWLPLLNTEEVPLLEFLELSNSSFGWNSPGTDKDWSSRGIFQAPCLRHISLNNFTESEVTLIHGPQLTTVALDKCGLTLKGALTLLKRCPNLTVCFIKLESSGNPHFGDEDIDIPSFSEMFGVITLQSLRSLTLVEYIQTPRYAHLLDLPALQSLKYSRVVIRSQANNWEDEERAESVNILLLLEQTGSHLKRLMLDSRPFKTDVIKRCLRLARHISSLSLKDPLSHDNSFNSHIPHRQVADEILKFLATPVVDGVIETLNCPYLEELESKNFDIYFSKQAVIEFIDARQAAASMSTSVSHLKHIDVHSLSLRADDTPSMDILMFEEGDHPIKITLEPIPNLLQGVFSPWRGLSTEELPELGNINLWYSDISPGSIAMAY